MFAARLSHNWFRLRRAAATPRCRRWLLLLVLLPMWLLAGCATVPHNSVDQMLQPSNDRNWRANLAVMPSARFRKDRVTVYNVRNSSYLEEDTYVVHHDNRTYDLNELDTMDFIVCPFTDMPSLAHTMLSFGFRDGQYLAVSVEARLEEGETYSALGGAMRQFEIMYVLADERDVIKLRTDIRKAEVYVYRSRATPEQVRELFVDVLKRVNTLKQRPEFYDTLMNNCTTNIMAHINRVAPGTIPNNPTSVLTGYSDRLAYSLGLLVDYGSFEETRRRAHVNDLVQRYADATDFSLRIRGQDGVTRMVERDREPTLQ